MGHRFIEASAVSQAFDAIRCRVLGDNDVSPHPTAPSACSVLVPISSLYRLRIRSVSAVLYRLYIGWVSARYRLFCIGSISAALYRPDIGSGETDVSAISPPWPVRLVMVAPC